MAGRHADVSVQAYHQDTNGMGGLWGLRANPPKQLIFRCKICGFCTAHDRKRGIVGMQGSLSLGEELPMKSKSFGLERVWSLGVALLPLLKHHATS